MSFGPTVCFFIFFCFIFIFFVCFFYSPTQPRTRNPMKHTTHHPLPIILMVQTTHWNVLLGPQYVFFFLSFLFHLFLFVHFFTHLHNSEHNKTHNTQPTPVVLMAMAQIMHQNTLFGPTVCFFFPFSFFFFVSFVFFLTAQMMHFNTSFA